MKKEFLFKNIASKGLIRSVGVCRFLSTRSDFSFRGFNFYILTMKIEVQIDDFYLDNEDIEQGLRDFLVRECVSRISKSIEAKIEDQINRQVKLLIEKSLSNEIAKKTKEFIESGEVPSRNNSSKLVSIAEYIKQDFEYNSGWSSHKESIKRIAEGFAKELKQRADLMFASQIVSKLSENGLLKEDVAKMLLETNK